LRQVLIVVAVLSALTLGTGLRASADSGTRPNGPSGIVKPQIQHTTRLRAAAAVVASGPNASDNLTYHGGPVMHASTTYAIYWNPAGYSFPSGYSSTIDQYFNDVAADSGQPSNVYSAATQYRDASGAIAYQSTFGGSATVTDAFPADSASTSSGDSTACGTYGGAITMDGLQNCVEDTELQTEIQSVASTNNWTPGNSVMYFIFTPEHVGSCFQDSANECAYSAFCAYHYSFTSGGKNYIYAVIPYPNEPFHVEGVAQDTACADPAQQFPNAADSTWSARAADQAINVVSHEHNEAITDPFGNAWWLSSTDIFNGSENGDLCAWEFGTAPILGGDTGLAQGYDQVIDGNQYFIQGEWSNKAASSVDNSGCVWSSYGPSNTDIPSIGGANIVGQTLVGDLGAWTGATSFVYSWLRCDESGTTCTTIVKKTTDAGPVSYTLVRADDKHTIKLRVQGKNGSTQTSTVDSLLTDTVLGEPEGGVPAINGTPTFGATLTGDVDEAHWTFSPTSYVYKWQRCDQNGSACVTFKVGALKPGAIAPTYKLTAADIKHTIVFAAVAANAVGTSFEADSDPTSIVDGTPENGNPQPDVLTAPVVGTTATLDFGTGWTYPATTYVVTWKRCAATCVAIKTVVVAASSSSTTYKPTATDDKKTLEAIVTGRNLAGMGAPITVTFGTVGGEPEGGTPTLSGPNTVGQKLTADPDNGNWGHPATWYTFTWLRCTTNTSVSTCTAIAAVTVLAGRPNPTHTLWASDYAHYMRVRVVAHNAAGASDPVTSASTGFISR
jgi:hypothetical protein